MVFFGSRQGRHRSFMGCSVLATVPHLGGAVGSRLCWVDGDRVFAVIKSLRLEMLAVRPPRLQTFREWNNSLVVRCCVRRQWTASLCRDRRFAARKPCLPCLHNLCDGPQNKGSRRHLRRFGGDSRTFSPFSGWWDRFCGSFHKVGNEWFRQDFAFTNQVVTFMQAVVVAPQCLSLASMERYNQRHIYRFMRSSTAGLGAIVYQERTPVRFLRRRVGPGDLLPCGQDREAVSGDVPWLRVWAPFVRAHVRRTQGVGT